MSNLNMAGRAGSPHQGQTGIISLCCLKLFLICFFFCLCDYFVWSQRPVLKSNLQAPTWLRLISHRLFITAITSPHVFYPPPPPLLLASTSPSLSIWLTSPLSLHPDSLFLIYSNRFSPFFALFLAPFLGLFSHLLFPSAWSLFFHFHLWMHSSCSCLYAIINLLHTYGPSDCHLLQQPRGFVFTLIRKLTWYQEEQDVWGDRGDAKLIFDLLVITVTAAKFSSCEKESS